jgi:hypothetical protein
MASRDAKLWMVGGSVGVLGLVLGYLGSEWRHGTSGPRVQVRSSPARGRGEYGSSRDQHEHHGHKHHKEHERGKH